MSNSSVNLALFPYGLGGRKVLLPVDGGSHIYAGTLVSQLGTGMLVPGSTANSGPAIGVATHEVDNTDGSDGDLRCEVLYGQIFCFANGTNTDACSEATTMFAVVYMGDDHTIYDNDGSATLKPAGRFMGLEPDGKVRVFVGMANLGDAFEDAVNIAISDAGTFTTATEVEGALQELYQNALTTLGAVEINLNSWREVSSAGAVDDTAAGGGVLSSDTTPVLGAEATTESMAIIWEAGNSDIIQTSFSLPSDFDDTANATLDLWVLTDNTGGGGTDAASFSVLTSWNNAAQVTDSATDGSPATTVHKITATIAAADIPASGFVNIQLVPATHASDPTHLLAARLNYKRKLLTS